MLSCVVGIGRGVHRTSDPIAAGVVVRQTNRNSLHGGKRSGGRGWRGKTAGGRLFNRKSGLGLRRWSSMNIMS